LKPTRSTLRKTPRREQRKQRDRCRPSKLALRSTQLPVREEAQGGSGEPPQDAGRWRSHPTNSSVSELQSPRRGGEGEKGIGEGFVSPSGVGHLFSRFFTLQMVT